MSLLLTIKSIFSKEDEINSTLPFIFKLDNTYRPTPIGCIFLPSLEIKKDLNNNFNSLKKRNLSYLDELVYSKQC